MSDLPTTAGIALWPDGSRRVVYAIWGESGQLFAHRLHRACQGDTAQYGITHRRTGLSLSAKIGHFETREQAQAALARLEALGLDWDFGEFGTVPTNWGKWLKHHGDRILAELTGEGTQAA